MSKRCRDGMKCRGCNTCCPLVGSPEEQLLPHVMAKAEAERTKAAQDERIRKIVREELGKVLGPIRRDFAEAAERVSRLWSWRTR